MPLIEDNCRSANKNWEIGFISVWTECRKATYCVHTVQLCKPPSAQITKKSYLSSFFVIFILHLSLIIRLCRKVDIPILLFCQHGPPDLAQHRRISNFVGALCISLEIKMKEKNLKLRNSWIATASRASKTATQTQSDDNLFVQIWGLLGWWMAKTCFRA